MILTAGYSDDARALWDAATALNRAAAAVSPQVAGLPPLLFFTDPNRTPRPWETAAHLPAGSAVVYRAFGKEGALDIGRRLREATADRGVKLLVGLDAELAQTLAADGVHLPEREAHNAPAIRSAHPHWLITAAWHGGPTSIQALDALILSPVFPAGGSSADKPPLGIAAFEEKSQSVPLPVYALGGIKITNAASLTATGACGLAAIDAIQSAFR